MGNSIEEDIAKVNTYIELVLEKDYCNCNELNTILGKHCDGSKNVAYAMQHILSDYKRVLKENEKRMHDNITLKNFISALFNDSFEKDYIPVQKIKDKIEEVNKSVYSYNEKDKLIKTCIIEILKELIEEE